MNVVEFFFNDLFHFIGLVIVIAVTLEGLAAVIGAARKR